MESPGETDDMIDLQACTRSWFQVYILDADSSPGLSPELDFRLVVLGP